MAPVLEGKSIGSNQNTVLKGELLNWRTRIRLGTKVQSGVGWFSLFCENLQGFQSSSQNENQRFSHKVITFLRTWTLVLSQVRTDFLKTLKVISWIFFITFKYIKTYGLRFSGCLPWSQENMALVPWVWFKTGWDF